MRKFKKLMCIALCLVMSLQLAAFTVSAESDLSEYTAEVGLLDALGITDGIHFESQANNVITRAEFAILLTRMLNANVEKYSSSTVINDTTNAQYPYVAYLMDNGIMKGDGNGNFLPNEHVTVHQALVTVMRILGYDVVAEAKGGTEGFYVEVASKLGLDAGIERYRDDRIQYKNVIRILYNALHTGLYVQTVFGNEEKFATDYDRTLLYDRFEIKTAEGTVMATDVSAIDGDVVSADSIRIGNHIYEAPTIDAEKYLGYYVNAYYKEKGAIRELVYLDDLEFSSSVTFDVAELGYNDFEYITEDESGKECKYTLSEDFTLVINGVFTVYDKELMLPDSGTVTLVNTNKDKKYETVIIRDERIEVIQLYNESEKILTFKFDNKEKPNPIDFNEYDEDKVRIYTSRGRLTDTSVLKEWAVATILENDGYVSIYVSTNTIKGAVEEINSENGITTATINDGSYVVSAVAKGDTVALGKSGTFYLDTNNRIVTFREGTGIWTYAYIFDAAKETALDSVYKFEVFNDSCIRESKVYEAAPTITVNGVKAYASGISKKTGENVLSRFEGTPTIVRYKMNAKEQITEIQTAGTTGFVRIDPGKIENQFDSTKMAYFDRVMGKYFAIGDTATIFIVPVNSSAQVDFTKKDSFAAGTFSYVTGNATSSTYYTMAFGEDKEDIISDFVILGTESTTFTRENSTQGVIKKISQKLNEDGEAVDYIEIFTTSGAVRGAYVDPDINYTADISKLSELDIVQFFTSGDILKDIKHQYDRSEGEVLDTGNYVVSWEGARKGWHTWLDFPIYNIESGYIQYQTTFANNNGKMLLPAGSARVVICNTVNGNTTFRLGSLADIKDISHFGESSDVVTYMYDTINTIYVYND